MPEGVLSRAPASPSEQRSLLDHVSEEARTSPASGIVEVFNYGRNRQGLIPLWVGESDMATPAFIREAAIQSLHDGETFYTYQRGIPELRTAIAGYMSETYPEVAPFSAERFFVTTGGMHALQIAVRIVCGASDEIIVPTPAWPNFGGTILATGARIVEVPMVLTQGAALRWTLDFDQIAKSISPRTRAIVINSPSNPLGWTATADELRDVLRLARQHGLWIIADEIYGRFVFDRPRAPSFHDIMDEQDLILFPQTFSKNWAMTGWRIGWLEASPTLGPVIENLVQYSTSGVPVTAQRAATVAALNGTSFIDEQVRRAALNRDFLCDALAATGRIRFAPTEGAFYLFFAVDGEPDSERLAFRLVDEAGLGLAPGNAFGRGGEGYLRMCFARHPDHMREVVRRLTSWLDARR